MTDVVEPAQDERAAATATGSEPQVYPVSFAQRRLWFLDRLAPDAGAYVITECWWLSDSLDVAALRSALSALVGQHEVLRTVFATADGEPMQVVLPGGALTDVLDVLPPGGDAQDAVASWARRPFDLTTGPLLRAVLAPAGNGWLFGLAVHHIAADGWSVALLLHELAQSYAGPADALPGPVDYADYAVWQRELLAGGVIDDQVGYWLRRLGDAPAALELPFDRPRPVQQSFTGGLVQFHVDEAVTARLDRLAADCDATLFMVLLALYSVLLWRYSGEDDLVVGVPVAGRGREEFESVVGFFANTLALRVGVAGTSPFEDLVKHVRDVALGGFAHQDVPFEVLVERLAPVRELSHNPVFQVMFALQNASAEPFGLPGVGIRPVALHNDTSKFDLSLDVTQTGGQLDCLLEFDSALFDRVTVEAMAGHFTQLCRAAAQGVLVDEMPLVDEAAQAAVVALGQGPALAGARTVHERIVAQAALRPSAVAVECGDTTLTYAELGARSEGLAARLIGAGAGPGHTVVVFLDRSVDLVVALLGVLRAGAAYVPVDPGYPPARVASMVRDSGASVVVTRDGLATPEGLRRVDVAPAATGATVPLPSAHPADLAYVIYTSGSTGTPKGVMVPHSALSNLVGHFERELRAGDDLVWLAVTTFSFDIAALELFLPLAVGGRVVVADSAEAHDPAALARRIDTSGCTALQATPATWQLLLDAGCRPTLSVALTGGERLPTHLADYVRRSADLALNVYGPTETTIWSSNARLRTGPVTIGTAIAGTRLLVLGPVLDVLPVGVPGELCIGGAGVTRGYRGLPGRTAERYVPDPYGPPGSVLYRTGDRARLRADGAVEFLGRVDRQVKIRGFRVEPAEPEAVLRGHPDVRDAAVVPAPDNSSLVAYVVADRVTDGSSGEIVQRWADVWSDAYRLGPATGPDYSGWRDSSTGDDYSAQDMAEWVDGTVASIRATAPLRVLEIGCGVGLLADRLAGSVEHYAGADVSAVAVARLAAKYSGDDSVRFRHAAADEIDDVGAVDLVVLNSVIQYFPSLAYLEDVLERAVRACRAGGAVFVGDVRSLPLLPAFHLSVLGADPTWAPARLLAAVREQAAREEELVVAPALFVRFAERHGMVADIRLKPGARPTEMNLFRYDVVLRPAGDDIDVALLTSRRWDGTWPEWVTTAPVPVVVADIPHPGQLPLVAAVAALEAGRAPGESETGMTPARLRDWAVAHGLRAYCVPSATPGRYHAVCTPPGREPRLKMTDVEQSDRLANDPAGREFERRLAGALRDHVARRLPEYLVPAAVVFLPALPRTPNGKTDTGALTRLAAPSTAELTGYVAPRTQVERTVTAMMADLLDRDRVGVRDDFFVAGGHSLLAARLLTRLRGEFGVDIPLRAFFASPNAAAIAEAIESRSAAADGQPAPVRVDRTKPVPASFAQQRLWFLDQVTPGRSAYALYDVVRLSADVDVEALRAALRSLVGRHEALRTTLSTVAGQPVQVVSEADSVGDILDLLDRPGDADAALAAWARQPFDLAAGPLVRAILVTAGESRLFGICLHHVIGDAWSLGVLERELGECYAAHRQGREPTLPALPFDYPDFAAWQRNWLTGDVLADRLAYWERTLSGAPAAIDLPFDRPRRSVQSFTGDSVDFRLDHTIADGVGAVARACGATSAMVLLAVFGVLLRRITGQTDIVVGTGVAGRSRVEWEPVVGFFANTLALRLDLGGDPSFAELVARVKETSLDAARYDDVPFELLVQRLAPHRELSYNPVFQVMFAVRNNPGASVTLPGVRVDPYDVDNGTSKFDLGMDLVEADGELCGVLEYDSALFDRSTAEALVARYAGLLSAAVTRPDQAVRALPLLTEDDHARILELGAGPVVTVDQRLVHRLIGDVAAAQPDAPAVVAAEGSLSYAELDQRANQVAHLLRDNGTRADDLVLVHLPRGRELVVALLGVLRAGAAYLPVDPAYPADRVASMLLDPGARTVITSSELAACLPTAPGGGAWTTLLLDPDTVLTSPTSAPQVAVHEDGLAYAVYTSGSTGTPKAALVTHRGLRNLCDWQRRRFGHGPGDRLTLLASVSFDGLAWELWPHLTAGAALHVVDDSTRAQPAKLMEFLRAHAITRCFLPTGLAQVMAEQEWPADTPLRAVFAGGDRLHWPSTTPPWSLTNHYGPTETTVVMTCAEVEPGADRREAPPLGRLLDNVRAYVLDDDLRPLPVGVPGELYIGGDCLGRGYHDRPGLTAARWAPDPFGPPGAVLYRSGDLVRLLPDGNLDFLARLDHQVKIHGYRVELGEIEAAIRTHPAVSDAVVVVHEDAIAGRQLAAYVTGDEAPDRAPLREYLRERLPDHMLPTRVVRLPALPLTQNGKVDRRALPPVDTADRTAPAVTIGHGTAAAVTAIWATVLGVTDLTPTDNFFDVGGTSLLLTPLTERLRAELGVPIALVDVFANPTIETQAAFVDAARSAAPQGDEDGDDPLPTRRRRRPLLAEEPEDD